MRCVKKGWKVQRRQKDYERIMRKGQDYMDIKVFWKNFRGWTMLMSGVLILIFLCFYIPMIMSDIPISEETILKQDITLGILGVADVVLLYFAVKWIWQTERLFIKDTGDE